MYVMYTVFKKYLNDINSFNNTVCIHIQMTLLHRALHGFVLTNMYVLLVIVLRSHVEECFEG